MNKIFLDNILAVKAKKEGDFPVFFMGTISQKGVVSSTIKMKDGSDLACAKFSIGLYDRKSDVDYVIKLAGLTDQALTRTEKYDNLDVVCFAATAKLAEGFKAGMQVCGGGVLRPQKDGKVQLLVSGLMKPVSEPVKDAKGRYDRYGFDALRPLTSRKGEVPVVFAGTRGKYWDVRQYNTEKGAMSVSHAQLSFYKQNETIKGFKESLGCENIAYEGENSVALRATSWRKDAEWGAKKADGDQLVGYGVLNTSTYKEKTTIELTVKGFARTFSKNGASASQAGSDTTVTATASAPQTPTPVTEQVSDMEGDEYLDMYI